MSYYATVGTFQGKHGAVLVQGPSLRQTRRILQKVNTLESDVVDLSQVTKNVTWTSLRKTIKEINTRPNMYKISDSLYFIP